MKKLSTKTEAEQAQATAVIRDFANEKKDRPSSVIAWEASDHGKTLVVFLPKSKVECRDCKATLLEQLKGMVADLERDLAATPAAQEGKAKNGKQSETTTRSK